MGTLRLHIDSFWSALVDMRKFLQEHDVVEHGFVCLVWDVKFREWQFYPEELVSVESHCILIPLRDQKDIFLKRLYNSYYSVVNPKFLQSGESFWLTNHTLDDLSALELYLSFILEEYFAKQKGDCFILEHRRFDESASKIEILHFHRLRSLFDGVVIDWQDALNLDQLDNALVAGEAPVRIIMDPDAQLVDHIDEIAMFHEGAPTYFIVASQYAEKKYSKKLPVGTDVFFVDTKAQTYKDYFIQRGIHSLLIEGEGLLNSVH